MICIIALFVFAVLGIFSVRYRQLAKEAFDCVFRRVTLRPCNTGFDQKMKMGIVSRVFKHSQKLSGFVYKRFELLSWFFTLLLFVSLGYSAYGLYNLYAFGNCNGPNSSDFCIFNPTAAGCGEPTCGENCTCAPGECNCAPGAANCTLINTTNSTAGKYDAFAKCLSQKGATMYGAEWCGHCKKQKESFGSSFSYVNYVECPENEALCTSQGIRGYPTWIINGQKYEGEQSFEALNQATGCSLPQ